MPFYISHGGCEKGPSVRESVFRACPHSEFRGHLTPRSSVPGERNPQEHIVRDREESTPKERSELVSRGKSPHCTQTSGIWPFIGFSQSPTLVYSFRAKLTLAHALLDEFR